MKRLVAILIPLLLLAGGASLYLGTQRAVLVNGQQVFTHARTVTGALRAAGLDPVPGDQIDPPPETPLQAGLEIIYRGAPAVFLQTPDGAHVVRTWGASPAQILLAAGVQPAPGDRLLADGVQVAPDDSPLNGPPHSLTLLRPITVTVSAAVSTTFTTTATTVGEALWEQAYPIRLGDEVSPALDAPLTPGLTITLRPAAPVTVSLDGREIHTRTARQTVGAVLEDLGVALVGEDYTLPAADQPLPADGLVRVVRVEQRFVIEEEPFRFESLYQPTPEVELDQRTLLQPGMYGVTARRFRVRLENGVETGRTLESEWTARLATPEIIGYGTKIAIRTVDTPDGPLQYWRSATFYATSYSPARSGTSPDAPWYGRTRSGKTLTVGMAAVDLNLVPLGTQMYVPGYGFVSAEDTGSGIHGKMIDLGYDDLSYRGWNRKVTVYFLAPPPSPEKIVWLWPQ